MNNWLYAGLFCLFLLAPFPVAEASTLEGIVLDSKSGQPVQGVTIRVNASGQELELLHPTGADGSFTIRLPELFSDDQLDTWSLALTFSAPNYGPRTQVRRSQTRGVFEFPRMSILLEPTSGIWNLPAGLRQQLQALKSTDGNALFVAPYIISEEVKQRLPANFAKILNFNIRRGISTHLQSLDLEKIPEDVSILALPLELEQSNAAQLRVIGAELNALALVGGLGSIGQDTGGTPVTELSTEFIIIPELTGFNPGTIYIDDQLIGIPLNPTTLYKGMDELWGRNTVLAISALETKRGLSNNDKDKLMLARSYLVAERAEIGGDNTVLLRQINTLIAYIDENLARLN
ncbi:carboxypeptidase-like regulatory domain-containing protein [Sneathiella marina]|uniref:Carboxypeptidase-like regulatory domain-containing protein n=1 Tax=Sneathiella marina TaxID=2950108 RepID=A0ABY4W9I6_9PROT|nr:carboxypeptidase-like regulatory domain-containing protein [Sneathiella marina]USG62425.1 carboxypeptidase-like regulatory domain-containing protein [Sneathiella marina]